MDLWFWPIYNLRPVYIWDCFSWYKAPESFALWRSKMSSCPQSEPGSSRLLHGGMFSQQYPHPVGLRTVPRGMQDRSVPPGLWPRIVMGNNISSPNVLPLTKERQNQAIWKSNCTVRDLLTVDRLLVILITLTQQLLYDIMCCFISAEFFKGGQYIN